MLMLQRMSEHTFKYKIRNEDIRKSLRVAIRHSYCCQKSNVTK